MSLSYLLSLASSAELVSLVSSSVVLGVAGVSLWLRWRRAVRRLLPELELAPGGGGGDPSVLDANCHPN